MNPLKWFLNLFPAEANDSAGWGPFRLPDDAQWMQRAAKLHDWAYTNSSDGTQKRSEADWDLFWRWALEAKSEQDPIKRCKRAQQICDYWKIARRGGLYLWDT
jgi:hypothetical protein